MGHLKKNSMKIYKFILTYKYLNECFQNFNYKNRECDFVL